MVLVHFELPQIRTSQEGQAPAWLHGSGDVAPLGLILARVILSN